MDYTIKRRDTSSHGLDIDFFPPHPVLTAVLAQVRLVNYPKFMAYVSRSRSYGEEFVQIKNFREMDWEDKAWAKEFKGSDIKEGEIFLVHDPIGKAIVEEGAFVKILINYTSELIALHKSKGNVSETWLKDMGNALELLKIKITNNRV